jgi:hypothetical protein
MFGGAVERLQFVGPVDLHRRRSVVQQRPAWRRANGMKARVMYQMMSEHKVFLMRSYGMIEQ